MQICLIFTLFSCSKKEDSTNSEESVKEIKISGSDSEKALIKLLSKRFESDTKISIEGGGSGIGIRQLIQGEVDVANSSREMTLSEIDSARSKGIEPFPVIIAMDALAIITHSEVGVKRLSTIQIKQIFSGEIQNWKELGGKDLPITIYGRNQNSGTYKYVKDLFIGEENFPDNCKIVESNGAIVEAVKKDSTGIGYVGVAFAKNEFNSMKKGLWVMNIYIDGENRAYSPLEDQRVMDGSYPFIRPLFQYFNGKPKGQLKDFLDFELSEEGQEMVFQFGYFPVPPELNENYQLAEK